MNIALPILLLVFGALTFWLLTESKLRWYYKASCISVFCIFTIIFWFTIHSYLGWPAHEEDMPDKVLVHWVVIKEPNEHTKFNGAIYFLLESVDQQESSLQKFFGYKSDNLEPRLFGVPYSRSLHEQIEEELRGKLKKGHPVVGRLRKKEADEQSKKGDGEGDNNTKGDGSKSQRQQWEFHMLRPSDFLQKP